jgi:hypothetical protein
MSAPFIVTYVALWVLVLVIGAAVLVLFHMEGQRYLESREGRREQGPDRDRPLPAATWPGVDGGQVSLPAPGVPNLVVFAATSCRPCAELRPHIEAFAGQHLELAVTVVCAGGPAEVREWTAGLGERVCVVADVDGHITAGLRIGLTPFSVAVDALGVVRDKGIVNDTVALESATRRILPPVALASRGE